MFVHCILDDLGTMLRARGERICCDERWNKQTDFFFLRNKLIGSEVVHFSNVIQSQRSFQYRNIMIQNMPKHFLCINYIQRFLKNKLWENIKNKRKMRRLKEIKKTCAQFWLAQAGDAKNKIYFNLFRPELVWGPGNLTIIFPTSIRIISTNEMDKT